MNRPIEPRRGRSSRSSLSTKSTALASLTAAVLAVGGCQSKNTSSPPRDQLHVDKQTPAAQPAQDATPQIDSTQALTAKTEAWAREMQTLMGKKPLMRSGAAGEPSVVDFMEP